MFCGDYLLCGLRVRSGLELPELPIWTGAADMPPDVTIRLGEVPLALPDAVTPGRYLSVGADGAVLVHIVDLARFLVRDGREIVVQILNVDAGTSVRVILLNAVLAYLLHQRGAYPLHAAALRTQHGIVAIAGDRGAGKSTLSHRLIEHGFDLVSDDMTLISEEAETMQVIPTYPRLKLWRSAVAAAGLTVDGLDRVRDGMEKYDLRPRKVFEIRPAPLVAIVILAEHEQLAFTAIPPTEAIPVIQNHVMRRRTAIHLGRRAALLQQSARIVTQTPVYRLMRPKRFDMLPATVDLLVRRFVQ